MIEKAKFWRWTRVKANNKNYEEVLQSSRVNIVHEMCISPSTSHEDNRWILNILEDLLTAVQDGRSQLKNLHVTGAGKDLVDLNSLDPVLLPKALVRLEECSFGKNICRPLSTAQLVSVFTAIEQTNNLKLKSLNFPNGDYSGVPGEVLAAALVKLEQTNILQTELSPDQVCSLFTKMAESSLLNLKSLNLSQMDCSSVPAELFGAALVRILVCIDRQGDSTVRGRDQFKSVFSKILSSEEVRLRELSLASVSLSHISPAVVSGAAVRLERLATHSCDLNPAQLSALFTEISGVEDKRLRALNLGGNDLSSVPSQTLVAGILSGLEVVMLWNTKLTTDQLTALLAQISTREDHRLRDLNLAKNDLSSVPTKTLVGAISGLERIELRDASLTREQLAGIYRRVADGKCVTLKWINLTGCDPRSISPELRDRAKRNQFVDIKFVL